MIHQSPSDTDGGGAAIPPLRLFCESALKLEGKPVRFAGRPYLDEIFRATRTNLVIRAGRQVEKSSYICFRIGFELMRPNTKVLLVCPRQDQAELLMGTRFIPMIEESVLLQGCLGMPKKQLNMKTNAFGNGSKLFVRSAFRSADAARGISADVLVCDEYQDLAAGVLPVLKETLAHSERKLTILTGTPKDVTNHLEDAFGRSTARVWTVVCPGCGTDVVPDERSVGPDHYLCPACLAPIDWQRGRWVTTNPHATGGEGFWLPQIITPWIKAHEFHEKRKEYDADRVLNEVLGLSTTRGTLAIPRGALEACCSDRAMAASADDVPRHARQSLVLGIDWGSGLGEQAAVVIVSASTHPQRLTVWYWGMVGGPGREPLDEIRQLCDKFGVSKIVADARGGGAHRNRELWVRLGSGTGPAITGVGYADSDSPPKPDGRLWSRDIDKTKWVGGLCARVREKLVEFPRSDDCALGFDHVASEQAEHDAESRMTRYRAAAGRPDDLLHPLVYVLVAISRTESPEWAGHDGVHDEYIAHVP